MKNKLNASFYAKRIAKAATPAEMMKATVDMMGFFNSRASYAVQLYREGVMTMNPEKVRDSFLAFA